MAYNEFAYFYDELNSEADYDALYRYVTDELAAHGIRDGILADLGCGTGDLTLMLAQAGYDVIGIDRSEEMLSVLREKADELDMTGRILLLRQDLLSLDLYGTIDACVCCLDSVNYVTSPQKLERAFQRVHTFLMPGGLFMFDVNTPDKLRALDGQVFLDESADAYCVWRAEYSRRRRVCSYFMDIFRLEEESGLWERGEELHEERAYTPEELTSYLRDAGFTQIQQYGNLKHRPPKPGEDRIFFTARKEV